MLLSVLAARQIPARRTNNVGSHLQGSLLGQPVRCSACCEVATDKFTYRDLLIEIRSNEWEGAEEAFSLLKGATVAVLPPKDDLRTALRSLVGAITSEADDLSTGSLIEACSLLATWSLLSDKTALNLMAAISRRFEGLPADEASLCSCAAALVQLRSSFAGTDAQHVAQASANRLTDSDTSFVFDSGVAANTLPEVESGGLSRMRRSVPGELQIASQQVCDHMIQAVRLHSSSSAKTVIRVMWCCCHWGLRPLHLLNQLPDESQLAEQVAVLDVQELTAAAWTCGVLQDACQNRLLQAVAQQGSCYLAGAGTEQVLSLNQCSTISWSLGRCNSRQNPFWVHLSKEFPVMFSNTARASSSTVARLLWGMAAARYRHVGALREVVKWLDSGRRLRICSPTELSHIIWSFSVLNFSPGHGVLQQLNVMLAKALEEGTLGAGDAMVSAAALSSIRSLPSQLLMDLAECSAQSVKHCTTEQIVIFVRLLAGSNARSVSFFDATAAVISERASDVRPDQMLTVITSFQRLSMPLKELMPAASSFTQQHICSLEATKVADFLSALVNVCLPLPRKEECDVGSICEALVEAIIHHLPQIPRGSLSDVAWACATLQLRSSSLMSPLEAQAVKGCAYHSSTSICTLIWAFAKLGGRCDKYLCAVNHRLCGLLASPSVMQPRDVALLLWSFAEMKHIPSQKLAVTLQQGSVQQCRTVYGMQMLSRLHKAAKDLLPQQDSHSLSLTLIAFNKLQYRPIQLMCALSSLSDEQIASFEPLHIANLIFALGSLSFSPEEQFLHKMVVAAELQADQFKMHEWANLTWALAKFSQAKSPSLRKSARSALARLAPSILPSVDTCSAQDCSRLLWAFRRAGVSEAGCQELVFALILRCARVSTDLSARDMSTVLWAAAPFSALNAFPMSTMHELTQVLQGNVGELEVQGLTACLTGLASLRLRPHILLSELDRACSEALRGGSSSLREVALQLSAFAQLGADAPQLCSAVCEERGQFARHHKLDVHSRILLLWAALLLTTSFGTAVCDQQEQALYALAPSHGMSDTALVQLFQAGLQGKTFLPRRCTLFRRSVVAFERVLQHASGNSSDKSPDHNLMVTPQDILVEASKGLASWGVGHQIINIRDASRWHQPVIPHLLCFDEVPGALRDTMFPLRELQLRSELGLSDCSNAPRPNVAQRNHVRIVVVPDEWLVESIPAIEDDQPVNASHLTGFARLELLRMLWACPETLLLRSSRVANLAQAPPEQHQTAVV